MSRYVITVDRDESFVRNQRARPIHKVEFPELPILFRALANVMETLVTQQLDADLTLEVQDRGEHPYIAQATIFVAHRFVGKDTWEAHAFPFGSKDNDE